MPARLGQLRVLELRELEVGRRWIRCAPLDRPAAVEAPEPEAEHDHVRSPDRQALEQQLRAALLLAAQERADQRHERERVRRADDREQPDRRGPAMTELLELVARPAERERAQQ